MKLCKICGKWIYDADLKFYGAHVCPPAFRVWLTESNDRGGAATVYASDAESAATGYLDGYDHEGNLGPHEVAVIDAEGVQTLWTVEGEQTINWWAEAREVPHD